MVLRKKCEIEPKECSGKGRKPRKREKRGKSIGVRAPQARGFSLFHQPLAGIGANPNDRRSSSSHSSITSARRRESKGQVFQAGV